jgi:ankyrin repeat protein
MRAVENGYERVVELLLQNGASPDFDDRYGWTSLAWAVEGGNVAILRLLLAQGAKIDYIYNIVSVSSYTRIGFYDIDG